MKHGDSNVHHVFLEPFILELEEMFLAGFPVSYDYPADLISQHVETPGSSDGKLRVHTMLMAFTEDAPAQCKFGGVKDGVYGGCMRHQVSMELRRDTSRSKSNLLYCNTRRKARHSPMPRSCKSIQSAASHW